MGDWAVFLSYTYVAMPARDADYWQKKKRTARSEPSGSLRLRFVLFISSFLGGCMASLFIYARRESRQPRCQPNVYRRRPLCTVHFFSSFLVTKHRFSRYISDSCERCLACPTRRCVIFALRMPPTESTCDISRRTCGGSGR